MPQGAGNAGHVESRFSLGTGELTAVLGALVLVGSLFLDWYRYPSANGDGPQVGANAWQTFSASDLLLAGLAAAVVLATIVGAVRREDTGVRYATCLVMGVAGLAALGVMFARFAFPPSSAEFLNVLGVTLDAVRLPGVFVALGAAVAMAVGGVAAATGAILTAASWTLEQVSREA